MSIPASLLTESITVQARAGQGGKGATYSASATYANCAYAEPGYRRVVNRQGQEIVSNLLLVMNTDVTLNAGDKVTWNGTDYIVIDSQRLRPHGSTHHQEVYLQGTA